MASKEHDFLPYELTFALNVLRHLPFDKNVIFSPMAIRYSLGLAYIGANGQTKRELAQILCGHDADEESVKRVVGWYHDYLMRYEEITGRMRLTNTKEVNRVYIKQSHSILPSYSHEIETWLQAGIESIDVTDRGRAAQKINDYVKEATNNKIRSLIKDDIFTDKFCACIVNVLYFEEEWRYRFKDELTKPGLFHLTEGKTATMDFMNNESKRSYFENDVMEIVLLKYADTEFNMALLLPKDKYGLDNLLQGLSGETLLNWLNSTQQYLVNVSMPKIKIEMEIPNLKDILQSMGAKSAFDPKRADFSMMTEGPFWFNNAIHKAFIDADENGTVAGAAGATSGEGCSRIEPEKRTVRADHPFAFFIIHQKGVIYMGTKRE